MWISPGKAGLKIHTLNLFPVLSSSITALATVKLSTIAKYSITAYHVMLEIFRAKSQDKQFMKGKGKKCERDK